MADFDRPLCQNKELHMHGLTFTILLLRRMYSMILSMALLSVGDARLRPLCMKNCVQHFPQAGVIQPYL